MEATPIQPSRRSSDTESLTSPASPDLRKGGKRSRRATVTRNACNACRQKKAKCDGGRPTCGRCQDSVTECAYEVESDSITRMQSLQHRLESVTEELSGLRELSNVLQHGSDQEASALLARLRMGESIENLITYVRVARHIELEPLDEAFWSSWKEACETNGQNFYSLQEPNKRT